MAYTTDRFTKMFARGESPSGRSTIEPQFSIKPQF